MTDPWFPQPLRDEHEVGAFDCGVPALNRWLRDQAKRAQAASTSRTYVWAKDDGDVVAYYSVAPTQVFREDLPRNLTSGYSRIPAYLLAKLALDRSLHGQGWGALLLVDALETIAQAAETGGGRLVVVDAIDDRAVAFYEHHDFVAIEAKTDRPRRLYMKIATIRNTLGVATIRITSHPPAQLASIEIQTPDGRSIPTVISMAEFNEIVARMNELAERHPGNPGAVNDLARVFVEVLGRNPLTDQSDT